ncbi:hypothetical protein, partial [Burkholderia pseudomallei]|uniref:hypothetical protein n=1 Tax=Burkholderia pseudomallei TaxID=28450 RepID=UPI001AD779AC
PDPRKTKPHAHKNVGFVSSLTARECFTSRFSWVFVKRLRDASSLRCIRCIAVARAIELVAELAAS